jgi:sec-independent protein translocase protein TatC
MSKQQDELFKGSVMTFGQHLNELRTALWRAVLGLAIGVLLGFFLANPIVRLIQSPMESALQEYYLETAKDDLHQTNPNISDAEAQKAFDQRMVYQRVYVDPQELAKALSGQGHALSAQTDADNRFAPPADLFQQSTTTPAATAPRGAESTANEASAPNTSTTSSATPAKLQELLLWRPIDNDPRTRTKSLSGQEPFMIWMKAALIAGLVIASPWVFYQLWMFVAAGLYPTERKYIHIFLPFSIGLFLFGVVCSTFVFAPILKFFLSFNRSMGIEPEPRISEWLSFVLFLPLGFGLTFQLPLVMLFLERIGVMTVRGYLKQWRFAVLVIWIIAAIVTPGDPYSIFLLGLPMTLLFFSGVLLCHWWPREKSTPAATL